MADGAGVTTSVDLLGRLVSYTDTTGQTSTITYNQAGQLTATSGVTIPATRVIVMDGLVGRSGRWGAVVEEGLDGGARLPGTTATAVAPWRDDLAALTLGSSPPAAVQALTAAGVDELEEALSDAIGVAPLIVGTVVSLIVAYVSAAWLLRLVHHSLAALVWYRVALGVFLVTALCRWTGSMRRGHPEKETASRRYSPVGLMLFARAGDVNLCHCFVPTYP